ncbi:lasso peptide biosynthesis PqqD family chaperone [Amycolatopsis magusensis]|uniref:Coenzyme PQQ synthesis protein D (PqqD) n=1 Tax=Amycolatopsis magusensis TaxID=882444 RepID=A0ABS4PW08_9PSEU|nr:lasso peptide biosynthesis PqqD family chaperone [Amycolatopsis magusensis]MBP2182771.1 hypothetical protein [Amycolatopsis magusensis]MDI5980184.1 lasso peptide biosynthesis PqqD family chaperone [Amycolatopsis magusensis]
MSLALADHVSVTETDSGMVLLDQRSGRYWQLNTTAAVVIRTLLDGKQPDDATTVLCARYPADAERVAETVSEFTRALRQAKLVTG